MTSEFVLKPTSALFLDRDGVINERKIGGYILSYSEFQFKDGVKQALKMLARHFSYIFIVTNQQCIGKKLITEEDFEALTDLMVKDIEAGGGRIDKVYHCPDLKTQSSPNRKPNVGMAFMAARDFPQIVFSHSVMVGDTMPDMIFGKRCGMTTIFIDNGTETDVDSQMTDMTFKTLLQFAEYIENNNL
ncbi:MAG: HAD-IIIA family hydrolase [Bacteroidales bacterium]|nr:HAD-IIIA family hydrolase [Bacteroidales bacterium]